MSEALNAFRAGSAETYEYEATDTITIQYVHAKPTSNTIQHGVKCPNEQLTSRVYMIPLVVDKVTIHIISYLHGASHIYMSCSGGSWNHCRLLGLDLSLLLGGHMCSKGFESSAFSPLGGGPVGSG